MLYISILGDLIIIDANTEEASTINISENENLSTPQYRFVFIRKQMIFP
jgi:hypothetical protein